MRLLRLPLSLPVALYRFARHVVESGDLMTLIIGIAMLLMPALALNTAAWPVMMQIILPVLVISMLVGYGLARSYYDELFALLVSAVSGGLIILLVAAPAVSGNIVTGIEEVLTRTLRWLIDATTGGINQDDLVFSLLVATLFWYLGYNAAWHLFRIDRVGRVLLPPALILVTNMVIYTGEETLEPFLAVFLFTSMVLIVRSSLGAREWDWYNQGIRVPRKTRTQFLRAGAMMSLVALLGAGFIPTGDLQERLNNFQEFLRSDPVRQMTEFWNRLISPIESEGPATADYYGGDNLNLSGAIRLGDQVIMLVDAPTDRRYYWRSRVFENYSNGGWSSSATLRVPDFSAPIDLILPPELTGDARVPVQQRFTIGTGGTRLIYTAPQPSLIEDVTGRIDLIRLQPQLAESSQVNISVIRPAQVLERGESYTATSLMSVASAFQLRAAGTDYPDWVRNPNAQPVFNVSPRILETTRTIVAQSGATNPYDTAKAIETWLRTNITYNESIPAPPPGVDPVDWFLHDMQQGYCTYYATAMIVMLRSQGIPARMAAGFAEGDYEPENNAYVVRERDAHTWVEVYFPGYGWIEFEPTAAEQPINRDGDDPFEQDSPVPQAPLPTAPPTNTPTPVPSPTPQATSTPDSPESGQNQPPPPTITLTVTATPTATPVIVPTVAPPVQPPPPPNNDFLSFLLPAIGTALLIMLLILLLVLVGVFIYWWWEWRGMGGLSPVARAYARLERYMGLIGWLPSDRDTTEEKRRKMVQQLPPAERPITAITRTYTVERYSRQDENQPPDARSSRIAENAWLAARRNILSRWLRRFMFWRRDR